MAHQVRFLGNARRSLETGIGAVELNFLLNGLQAFDRILPHLENTGWKKIQRHSNDDLKTSARWKELDGQQRRAVGVKIYLIQVDFYLETKFVRKKVPKKAANATVPDNIEMTICKVIAELITDGLGDIATLTNVAFISGLMRSFDDFVMIEYLKQSHKLEFEIGDLIDFFRDLSEQSYENNSLSYGIIIDKKKKLSTGANIFPKDYLEDPSSKRYRAFTDGYRSAFLLDSMGKVQQLIDLEHSARKTGLLRGEHYYPEWCRNISLSAIGSRIGLSLTRQGDILYFEHGSMKFTRRFGRWQYWNHAYIIDMLKTMARAQKVKPSILGKVTAQLYKLALDISFRHSGGLFIILKNKAAIHSIVRVGDALQDSSTSNVKREFDRFLRKKSILGIDRNIALDLASIDGALVFANNGELLSYGAILSPRRNRNINTAEGSRSKAAIGASYFGVTIKVSSDGDISIYEGGKRFLQI